VTAGAGDPGARTILHLDMDAFYASVEQRDDPSLVGKPVLVGGPSRRGVVAAASYEARRYGVHSAMPMAEAMRRCPHAVVVSSGLGKYAEESARIFAIFRRYTPLVEGLSLDEAFLDVTASRSLFGDGATIAARIRQEIRDEIGLTASAGVAPCKFVAKIASDLDKPDGLVVVGDDESREFLAPLAIDRMWGVGPKAASTLRAAGFETIGDLAAATPDRLEVLLGSWGRSVQALACGIDDRPVVPGEDTKSIGAEHTFEHDLHAARDIERALLSQARRVAQRLVRNGLCGSIVTVKLKYADFSTKTRQQRLPDPVADTDSIHRAARALLLRFPDTARGVRLTGVSMSGLSLGPPPAVLFPDQQKLRRERLEHATRELEDRFGAAGLTRASLLDDRDSTTEARRSRPRSAGGGRDHGARQIDGVVGDGRVTAVVVDSAPRLLAEVSREDETT
jgi:DNA polymerase-4